MGHCYSCQRGLVNCCTSNETMGAQRDGAFSEYITIFKRKREYYIGPGNELSRTDYGIYTTKLDENGKYHTDDNIFENW